MNIPTERTADRLAPQADPAGEQEAQFIISSTNNYKKVATPKTRRNCFCPACIDSGFEYKDELLLRDNDPQIFQLFGRELVK